MKAFFAKLFNYSLFNNILLMLFLIVNNFDSFNLSFLISISFNLSN